jgi:hypothetical protein
MAIMRLVLGVLLLLDVFPNCGGTKVVIREAGEDCGHHGPHWTGDCRAPLECWRLEAGGTSCTIPCDADAACASLGADFKCTAKASPYLGTTESTRGVCSKP